MLERVVFRGELKVAPYLSVGKDTYMILMVWLRIMKSAHTQYLPWVRVREAIHEKPCFQKKLFSLRNIQFFFEGALQERLAAMRVFYGLRLFCDAGDAS